MKPGAKALSAMILLLVLALAGDAEARKSRRKRTKSKPKPAPAEVVEPEAPTEPWRQDLEKIRAGEFESLPTVSEGSRFAIAVPTHNSLVLTATDLDEEPDPTTGKILFHSQMLIGKYCIPQDLPLCYEIADSLRELMPEGHGSFPLAMTALKLAPTNQAEEAVKIAERLSKEAPDSPDTTMLLSGLAYTDLGADLVNQLAALLDRFIQGHPDLETTGEVLNARIDLQLQFPLPLAGLIADAGVFRPSPGYYDYHDRLRFLKHLGNPLPSYLIVATSFIAPILIYLLLIKLFYHPEAPARGPITPRSAHVLMWVFTVIGMLGAITTDLLTDGLACFMVLVLHKFFALPGEVAGQQVANYGLGMAMCFILIMIRQSATAGQSTGATPGTSPLPGKQRFNEENLVSVIMIVLLVGIAVLFEVVLGSFLLGVALDLPLMIPVLIGMLLILAARHRKRPLPDGPIKTLVQNVFAREQVPLAGIWEDRYHMKLFEFFLLPQFRGPVHVAIDPEIVSSFSAFEFEALLMHQIGHYQEKHRLKILGLALGILAVEAVLLGLMVAAGLHHMLPLNFLFCLFFSAVSIGLFLLERAWDKRADDYALTRLGRHNEYLGAIVRAHGVDPAGVDFSNLRQSRVLTGPILGRVEHVMMRWRQAYASAPPAPPPLPPEHNG